MLDPKKNVRPVLISGDLKFDRPNTPHDGRNPKLD